MEILFFKLFFITHKIRLIFYWTNLNYFCHFISTVYLLFFISYNRLSKMLTPHKSWTVLVHTNLISFSKNCIGVNQWDYLLNVLSKTEQIQKWISFCEFFPQGKSSMDNFSVSFQLLSGSLLKDFYFCNLSFVQSCSFYLTLSSNVYSDQIRESLLPNSILFWVRVKLHH